MNNPNQKNSFIEAADKGSWGTLDNSISFAQIKVNDFIPAIDHGIAAARRNIQKIKDNPDTPNFENTMLALETASELLEVASGVYFNLFSAEASPELQTLAKEISPKSAAFSSEVSLDEKLFARIRYVYEHLDQQNLNPEQRILVEKSYRHFVKNGALLDPAKKELIRKIDQDLSLLGPQFSENVLRATNSFELWIRDSKDLAGLPESAVESAAHEALGKGQKNAWLFTLQAPSFMPFMQYADNRDLRKKMWIAFGSRAAHGTGSNQRIILELVRLRDARAKLLGYQNHAQITLTERMAETPEKVLQFLGTLLQPSKKAAEKDLQELKDLALQTHGLKELMPWDVGYYSEKLKKKKFDFSEEDLRPYFKLENVVQGVFAHATQLYGLQFTHRTDIPKYHPDVETYEVKDRSGDYVGLFYTDFFPRETKKDGAWMTTYRDQGLWSKKVLRPHVSIVCNFTKSMPNKPSLLTYDEVLTLFHEFGHALHSLLSKCTYRSLSGTNVYWDFVELPSQIMENWVKEKEGLDVFARHYQSNAPIPAELVEKIRKSNQFQAGYHSLRQINFAYLDMAWYTTDPQQITDVPSFELASTAKSRLFPPLENVSQSCSFSHIFAGGYSAGYYSYKWAEVLDADAFEAFKENGIFNPTIASAFRDAILSKGGTAHPMELYKKFRGREPDPNALLRRDGLI